MTPRRFITPFSWLFTLALCPTAATAQDVPSNTASTPEETHDLSDENGEVVGSDEISRTQETAPDHVRKIAPFKEDERIQAELMTSEGTITCALFAGQHPLTVLNFIALALGKPAWTDALGIPHRDPYYHDLPFDSRVKDAYAVIGKRPEGVNFTVVDERCRSHEPKAGAIAMVQNHPGDASTTFMLLAKDIPEFSGMYAVFGTCTPLETIQNLTRKPAVLKEIRIPDPY